MPFIESLGPYLHLLISALLPLVLIGTAVGYLLTGRYARQRTRQQITRFVGELDALNGRSIDNLPAVAAVFAQPADSAYFNAFSRMQLECEDQYQGRWLPDPAQHLRPDAILGSRRLTSLSLVPAARLLAVGILGSLVSLLLQNQIPVANPQLGVALILLPGLTGLAGSLLTAAASRHNTHQIEYLFQDLRHALACRLPVFSDQTGLAQLVDRFLDYDRQMQGALLAFNETAKRLADSEMADGIRHSVEQVMLGSVAPSIQQATATLGNLASELTNRQERGMQELAVRFAEALSSDLAGHLQPINREIDLMGSLMSDVKNYIEIAMRAMDTTRQQSESLLADSRAAIQQMAESRSQLTEDFSAVDTQIQTIAATTEQMAGLYQGTGQGLSASLAQFGERLDQHAHQLESVLAGAVAQMQEARTAAGDQQASAERYLNAMQAQVDTLSGRLGTDIQNLLGQIRQETGAVAGHAGDIGRQLGSLNSTLDHSLNEFTQASSQYVKQTLNDLDAGLAELSERIARTAAELRDAVDALPAALRDGQSPHFGG